MIGMPGATAAVSAARRSRSSRHVVIGRVAPAATPGTGQCRAGLLPQGSAGASWRRRIATRGPCRPPMLDPGPRYKIILSTSAQGMSTAERCQTGDPSGSAPSVMPAESARNAVRWLATASTLGRVTRANAASDSSSQPIGWELRTVGTRVGE